MTESAETPVPYKVVYSEVVKGRLREFAVRAKTAGKKDAFADVLRDLERRLRLFPQFGEPLINLYHEDGKIYFGVVAPLVVRYAVFEERRTVMVSKPPELLPNAGF